MQRRKKYLAEGEHVHLPLGHPLDVVVGRVGGLLSHQQGDPLEHLVTCSVQCAVCSVKCAVCSLPFSVCTVQCYLV